ncbi:hypothetical protein [Flavobacterium sp. H122]|uniref:hypothetical protein n=1 Tax=Flavobacterium sp. H122 TaxID=2529860 RepID=UPI0010AA63A6|nr:hypothetical protein [Flavobacterium sp. H122]
MGKIFILIALFLILGCKNENMSRTGTIQEKVVQKSLPKFATLKEMLMDVNDFSEDNNTLKFISENEKSMHVQVSKPILEEDLESVKKEIVKRDIVYVTFQVFAQTDIDEITITSIPIDGSNYKLYFEEYALTLKISRKKAKEILTRYFNSEDFSILFENENEIWLPNKNFNLLKFDYLDEVFEEMSN